MAQTQAQQILKQIRQSEKSNLQMLGQSHKMELDILKAAGLSKEDLAAEKVANQALYKSYQQAIKTEGLQSVDVFKNTASTYSDNSSAVQAVDDWGDRLKDTYDEYKFQPFNYTDKGNSEYTATGVNLHRLYQQLDAHDKTGEWSKKPGGFTQQLMSTLDGKSTGSYTADEWGGRTIKQDKQGNYFFKIDGPDGPKDEDHIKIYLNKDTNGKYSYKDMSTYTYSAPDKKGFSPIGIIASLAMAAMGIPSPFSMISDALGFGGTLAADAVGSSLVGGFESIGLDSLSSTIANAAGNVAAGSAADLASSAIDLGSNAVDGFDFSNYDWSDWTNDLAQGALDSTVGGSTYGADYLAELAAQDFTDFGTAGVEALGKSLGAASSAWTPISWQSNAIDVLSKLGIDYNTAASIVSNSSSAASLMKSLAGTGSFSQGVLGTIGQLIGNNQLANSTSDILGDWLDEIKGASALTPAQTKLWGTTATDMLDDKPYQELIDSSMGGLTDLYDDPMSNPIMQAVAELTGENSARRSAAGRGLNAGSMPHEMQQSLLAELGKNFGNIATPMNQSFAAATGAQNQYMSIAPQLIQAANGPMNAIGGFVKDVAAPAELMTNPVGTGLQTLYGNQGKAQAQGGNSAVNSVINAGAKWGLDKLGNWIWGGS